MKNTFNKIVGKYIAINEIEQLKYLDAKLKKNIELDTCLDLLNRAEILISLDIVKQIKADYNKLVNDKAEAAAAKLTKEANKKAKAEAEVKAKAEAERLALESKAEHVAIKGK